MELTNAIIQAVVQIPIFYNRGGGNVNRNDRKISFPDLKTLKALPPLPGQEKERIAKILNKNQKQMKQKIKEGEEGELSDS